MARGNLSDFLDKTNEKYQELRKKGLDLYYVTGSKTFKTYVLPLPDKEICLDGDGRVTLKPSIIEAVSRMMKTSAENAQAMQLVIRPFTEPDYSTHLSMPVLERALNGIATTTHEIDVDVD